MPVIAVTIVDQTVAVTQVGEIGPTGATGPTGTVLAAGDGTAGAPGIAFASDTDTGLFRPGSNLLAASTGGTERWRASSSGTTFTGPVTVDTDGGAAGFRTLTVGGNKSSYSVDSPAIFTSSGGGSGMYALFGSLIIAGRNDSANGDIFLATADDGGAQQPRMTVTRGGNIAIGATNPYAYRLWVESASTDKLQLLNTSGSSNTIDFSDQIWQSQLVGSSGSMIVKTGGTTTCVTFGSGGHVTPGADNTQNFGSGSLRWATIYAGTGTINTSDERFKVIREGGDLSEAEFAAWSNVRAIVYQDRDAFDWKGDDARLHVGYSWQAIAAAFTAQGLDANRYGLWCEDPMLAPVAKTRTAQRQATDADGNPITEVVPVLDDAGEPVVEQVQATEAVEHPFEEVRIIDGAPVLVRGTRTVDQPLFDSVQVKDEAGELVFETPDPVEDPETGEIVQGQPVPRMAQVPRMVAKAKTETVPVMEDFEEEFTEMEPTGETRGALRYQECAVLEAAWLRRQLALVEARVAALEAS